MRYLIFGLAISLLLTGGWIVAAWQAWRNYRLLPSSAWGWLVIAIIAIALVGVVRYTQIQPLLEYVRRCHPVPSNGFRVAQFVTFGLNVVGLAGVLRFNYLIRRDVLKVYED